MWLILGLIVLTVGGGSLFPDREKNAPDCGKIQSICPDRENNVLGAKE